VNSVLQLVYTPIHIYMHACIARQEDDRCSVCFVYIYTYVRRAQEVDDVMHSVRQRGRDTAAIHSILSQVAHHSPALLHQVLQENIEDLSEFIQVYLHRTVLCVVCLLACLYICSCVSVPCTLV